MARQWERLTEMSLAGNLLETRQSLFMDGTSTVLHMTDSKKSEFMVCISHVIDFVFHCLSARQVNFFKHLMLRLTR